MESQSSSLVTVHLTLFNLFATCLTYFAVTIAVGYMRAPKYPQSLPWVGNGKTWFASLKNEIQGFSRRREWILEGYERYNKRGMTFIMPPMLGIPTEAVVPQAHVPWMLDLPDNVLSTMEAHYDTLFGAYSFINPWIVTNPYHEHVLFKNLTRNLNAIIPELADEIKEDIEDACGLDTEEFKEVKLLDGFLMNLIPKITNRMLVGKSICKNKDYLDGMIAFAMDVVRGMVFLPLIPKMLHPVVGSFHSLWPKYHHWQTKKYSGPLVQKRIEDIKRKEAGNPDYADWPVPNDFVTWTIQTATAEGRTEELDPERITKRICSLNFASIHTTAITANSAIIDILNAGPEVMEVLCEEAVRIFDEDGQQWTKAGLARMHKLDSAIRESQRFSSISLNPITRKVVAKEGITDPDGNHFEYGSYLSCAWLPVTKDSGLFDEPDRYDAFRYSREREQYEVMSLDEKLDVNVSKLRQSGMVTTSHVHQGFGQGRHAW